MKRSQLDLPGRSQVLLAGRLLALLATLGATGLPEAGAAVYVRDDRLWPKGMVPFEWDAAVPYANRLRVIAAMNLWKDVAHVDFVLRTDESDYVLIQNAPGDTGSRSPKMGRDGGQQDLFIRQNLSNITDHGLAHELGHVLGFYHTQQRVDRDDFLTWHEDRTTDAGKPNFSIATDSLAYPRHAMDYDSVMSYGRCTFALCEECAENLDTCRVLEINDPDDAPLFDSLMGQREYLTRLDALTMSFLYPPAGWRFVEAGVSDSQETGTFQQPYLTMATAISSTPWNATVWLQPGHYQAGEAAIGKAMTFRAPLGGVTITSN